MLNKIKSKIEKNRNSGSLLWQSLVFGKDFIWNYYNKLKRINFKQIKKYISLKYLSENPQFAINFLQEFGKTSLKKLKLNEITPPSCFEDLIYLFNCNKSNRGIIRINLDEAVYLFKTARSLAGPKVLEIGRVRGGSTILLATAVGNEAEVDSVDIAPPDDEYLKLVLMKMKLDKIVNLIKNDVNNLDFTKKHYDLIFIDGDHSYKGVSKNYLICQKILKKGGHMIFHDYTKSQPGVVKLIDEIRQDAKMFKEVNQIFSLVHFIKIK